MKKQPIISLLIFTFCSIGAYAESQPFTNDEAKVLVKILEHRKCHAVAASSHQARQRKSVCSIKVKEIACDEENDNGKNKYTHCHFIDKQAKDETVFNLAKDTKTVQNNQQLGSLLVKYAKQPSLESIKCRLERVLDQVKSTACTFIK